MPKTIKRKCHEGDDRVNKSETAITISVIMPTYQGEQFLVQALDSIATQSVLPDELIISDDNSTDNTCKIVANMEKRDLFDVRLLHHDLQGPTKNYLNAIGYASGEIVVVCDQDDVWLPHKIERILSVFACSQDISLVSHDSLLADNELNSWGNTIRGGLRKSQQLAKQINLSNNRDNFHFFLRGGLPFLAHTLSFRKRLISTLLNKPDDIDSWWFEDWLTCVAACLGRVAIIPEHLVIYRQHDRQTSGGD